MRNLILIARREYLEQIRGRAFKLTTILVPALFGLIIFIMYLAGRGATGAKHIVIASNDAALAADIRDHLAAHNDAKSRFEVQAPAAPGDRAALVDKVRTKSIDGFLWVDAPSGGCALRPFRKRSTNRNRLATSSPARDWDRRSIMPSYAAAWRLRGIPAGNIDAMLKNVEVETLQVTARARK